MSELAIVALVLVAVVMMLLTAATDLSDSLVRARADRLPPALSGRMREEWLAELEAIPNRASQITFALALALTRRRSFATTDEDLMPHTHERPPFIFFGGWKTLTAASTLLFAVVAYGASFLIQPRYASSALILVVPQRVSEEYVKSSVMMPIRDRLQAVSQQILSRTRLERVILDFDLYKEERRTGIMEYIVEKMRRDIEVRVDRGDAFSVGYVGREPRTVRKVADRLASLFIEESLRDREGLAENSMQFLESRIEDVGTRIEEQHQKIEAIHRRGGAAPPVVMLDYEMLTATYKDLFAKREQARLAANLERRQIGEQFKLLDPARLPERPIGPNRTNITLLGALLGFCLGLTMMLVGPGGRFHRKREAIPAEA